jgi:hypothetical protein
LKLNRGFCELFLDLITKSHVKELNVKDHAKTLYLDIIAILDRNFSNITEDQFHYVKSFIFKKYSKVVNEFRDDVLHLTLSHGDIKEDNLTVEKDNKFLAIDWEFCDFRLPSYDILQFTYRFPKFESRFYKEFFREIQWNLKLKGITYREISKYFRNLGSDYLDVFYLEKIKLRLFQFERRNFAKDFLSYIVCYIKGIDKKRSKL